MSPLKAVWFAIGVGAVALAVLGVALPLLPTTPFVLVAAFAFARSSDRWHAWLISHKIFGPIIENWREHGAISRRGKIIGMVSILAVFVVSLVLKVAPLVLAVQAVALTGAAAFLLSRPSPPKR